MTPNQDERPESRDLLLEPFLDFSKKNSAMPAPSSAKKGKQ